MSFVAFLGAIETGLLYGFLSLGVYLSFRVLKFPDLTVDGSFPLGAAVVATLITQGMNPWMATVVAMVAGALAGLCTAILSVRFNILNLLASILTMDCALLHQSAHHGSTQCAVAESAHFV